MSKTARLAAILALLAIASAAIAYGYLRDREVELRFTAEQLEARLAERLPFTETYLLVVDVTLGDLRVDLVDGSDRIGAGIDVVVGMPGIRGPVEFEGSIDLTSGIRYEPETGGFYLDDLDLHGVSLQGVPTEYEGRVRDALLRAIREYLRRRPVYTLEAQDVRHATARLLLKDVAVEGRELVVTLRLRGAPVRADALRPFARTEPHQLASRGRRARVTSGDSTYWT